MAETVGFFEWYRDSILQLAAVLFVLNLGWVLIEGTFVDTGDVAGLAVQLVGAAIWSLALAVLVVFCWHFLKRGVRYLRRSAFE